MDALWNAFLDELRIETPDAAQLVRITVRLTMAVLLTAVIGWDRERGHKTAGLRTHMLVALGSALFTVVCLDFGDAATRAIQGIATGIGFIGGGAILKLENQNRIRGLTTAGTIWLAAAIGVAAGLGKIGAAVVGLLLAWLIVVVIERVKVRYHIEPPPVHRSDENTLPPTSS